MNACKSMQPVSSSSRPCANKVQDARSKLFMGMYDASTGFGSPGASVVRCPRCQRTVGNVTGAGWRQATCDTCGGSLAMRQLDRNGKRFPQVQLLNPDLPDGVNGDDDGDDATARRFSLLEIE